MRFQFTLAPLRPIISCGLRFHKSLSSGLILQRKRKYGLLYYLLLSTLETIVADFAAATICRRKRILSPQTATVAERFLKKRDQVFQRDSSPSHRNKDTVALLDQDTPDLSHMLSGHLTHRS